VWAIIALLLVRYIDTGKSYRSMVAHLEKALPARHGCISSEGLGEPHRAMLHYFGGILTDRLERSGRHPQCEFLITVDNGRRPGLSDGPWKLVWEGRRPADKQEHFRLYRRQ
jgi:hypothetical protein